MFKEVIRTMDWGFLPQVGLIAFVFAFTLIVLYALVLSKKQVAAHAQISLSDDEPVERRDAAEPQDKVYA